MAAAVRQAPLERTRAAAASSGVPRGVICSPGMQREQMGDMPVPRLRFVKILAATPGSARACRSAAAADVRQRALKLRRGSSSVVSRIRAASRQRVNSVVQDLAVHRRPHAQHALVRRSAADSGFSGEIDGPVTSRPSRRLHQKIEEEQRRFLHHRVDALARNPIAA